jgi:hypothetical protein
MRTTRWTCSCRGVGIQFTVSGAGFRKVRPRHPVRGTRVTIGLFAGPLRIGVARPAHGVFTSVADLARKIRRYIRLDNKTAKPIRWSYRNPAYCISSTSARQSTSAGTLRALEQVSIPAPHHSGSGDLKHSRKMSHEMSPAASYSRKPATRMSVVGNHASQLDRSETCCTALVASHCKSVNKTTPYAILGGYCSVRLCL